MISTKASAVSGPTPGWSSVDALRDTSPLPAGSPGSVPRSSGSVDPATPEDRVVAGWPTEAAGMIPAARVRVPATTSSYSAGLRSERGERLPGGVEARFARGFQACAPRVVVRHEWKLH